MKIRYNAPVTLTFSLICALVLGADTLFHTGLIPALFSVPGRGDFSFRDPVGYVRLFTHVIGHIDWSHLFSNFSFVLLLGPILEEQYGSVTLLVMILTTSLITGLLNVLLLPSGLLGASGIVFMMILLVSFTNFGNRQIPMTFILVLILYLAREVINSFQQNSISEFAHILGGLCGSLFGFLRPAKRDKLIESP